MPASRTQARRLTAGSTFRFDMERKIRNALFERKKRIIRQTMNKHRLLISSCRMDAADVYQELAITMLIELERYDFAKCGSIDAYISLKLKYKLLHMRNASKLYGIPKAPRRGFSVAPLDELRVPVFDDFSNPAWIEHEIDILPAEQSDALNRYLSGKRVSRRNKSLIAARRHLRMVYDIRQEVAIY